MTIGTQEQINRWHALTAWRKTWPIRAVLLSGFAVRTWLLLWRARLTLWAWRPLPTWWETNEYLYDQAFDAWAVKK